MSLSPSPVVPFKKIGRFSFGMGDRFGRQGLAQLQAVVSARDRGIEVTPVWNKSNREHALIGSEPASVRAEAREAVNALGWTRRFHVDADHINLGNVDRFIEASDFYTIDVADYTGKPAQEADIRAFVADHSRFLGDLAIPGIATPLRVDEALLRQTAGKFLWAMQEAGRIYRHIADRKGAANLITEVSVDETDSPQTPVELLLILSMIAREGIPVQTIAPKFTGRFNKGVDYVGDVAKFEREFDEDLAVVRFAVAEFGLPATLKLSVHSGSDKFSLYPILNRLVHRHGAGLHVKTAGTTWLEEVIGLAESGGSGLALAQDIYRRAFGHFDELVAPYATVLDIDRAALPPVEEVGGWSARQYVEALRHDSSCPAYNPHFRQFLHVSFKIAAQLGPVYLQALEENEAVISRNVTHNLLHRHLLPIFGREG